MRVIRTQRYRIIEFNDNQEELFYKTIGCKRWYWNHALEDHTWIKHNLKLHIIPRPAEYKQNEAPFLKDVDSLALCNAQLDLEKALKNHYKNPKHFGYPKPKSRKNEELGWRSYTTNNTNNNIRITTTNTRKPTYSTTICLPKMGKIPIVYHKPLPDDAVIKHATIVEEPDHNKYISVIYETEEPDKPEPDYSTYEINIKEDVIAFDYSSPDFFYDNHGYKPDKTTDKEPVHAYKSVFPKKKLEDLEERIAREQRNLSRKQPGSQNYYKQLGKINRLFARQRHIREDFQHQLSCEITNQYRLIIVEDLNLKGIANKHGHLGKSTSRNAWGGFVSKLDYKAKRKGGELVKVDRFFASTMTCSCCGYKLTSNEKLSLSDREFVCPSCEVHVHRDLNAARNELSEGLRVVCSRILDMSVSLSQVRDWQLLACDNDNVLGVAEPVGCGGLLVLGDVRPVLSSLLDYIRFDSSAVLDHVDGADSVHALAPEWGNKNKRQDFKINNHQTNLVPSSKS